jgi:hypothetical protein
MQSYCSREGALSRHEWRPLRAARRLERRQADSGRLRAPTRLARAEDARVLSGAKALGTHARRLRNSRLHWCGSCRWPRGRGCLRPLLDRRRGGAAHGNWRGRMQARLSLLRHLPDRGS